MARPEHLSCINTAEGIRRINEKQEAYDRDPDGYERRERQHREDREQERLMRYELDEPYGYE